MADHRYDNQALDAMLGQTESSLVGNAFVTACVAVLHLRFCSQTDSSQTEAKHWAFRSAGTCTTEGDTCSEHLLFCFDTYIAHPGFRQTPKYPDTCSITRTFAAIGIDRDVARDAPLGVCLKQNPEVHPGFLVLAFRAGHLVVTELSQGILVHCLLKGLGPAYELILGGNLQQCSVPGSRLREQAGGGLQAEVTCCVSA